MDDASPRALSPLRDHPGRRITQQRVLDVLNGHFGPASVPQLVEHLAGHMREQPVVPRRLEVAGIAEGFRPNYEDPQRRNDLGSRLDEPLPENGQCIFGPDSRTLPQKVPPPEFLKVLLRYLAVVPHFNEP